MSPRSSLPAREPPPPDPQDPRTTGHRVRDLAGELLACLGDEAPLPRGLEQYREAWLRTLDRKPRRAPRADLMAALQGRGPILVSDFHPLRRSHENLARILAQLPSDRPVALLLELLPLAPPRPARQFLGASVHPLADGRALAEVYSGCLQALAARDGQVAGAWLPSGAVRRDHVAARAFAQMARALPEARWVLHFGDWHLADDHLPARLREIGARPVVLHLSPEPLWHPRRRREAVLDLGAGHWAWLETPPLARRLSARAEPTAADPEEEAEDLEDLVEVLAGRLAGVLDLPAPQGRPSLWPNASWASFRRLLPPAERRALAGEHPPRAIVFHPHLPQVWLDRPPDPNTVVEIAAHSLVVDWPVGSGGSLDDRVRARAFDRLVATLANPMLRAPRRPDLARRLFARAPEGLPVDCQRLLTVEHTGALLGARLARELRPGDERLRDLLQGRWPSSIQDTATATIRAS